MHIAADNTNVLSVVLLGTGDKLTVMASILNQKMKGQKGGGGQSSRLPAIIAALHFWLEHQEGQDVSVLLWYPTHIKHI